jgi:hypothetical protein
MFVGIGFEGLEEGGRGFYEEHALPPACRHGGQDRERDGKGRKGWRERSGRMCLGWGRFGRVSAGAIPGQLARPRRATRSRSTTLNLSFKAYDSRILYLPDYRLIPLPCVVLIIPLTTKDAGSHSPTISSA